MFFSWDTCALGIVGDIVGVVVSAVLVMFMTTMGEFGVGMASKFGNLGSEGSDFVITMLKPFLSGWEVLFFPGGFFWFGCWWDICVLSIGRHSGCLLWIGPVFHAKGRYPFTG